MADADKQKEMDAKKAEVEMYFIIILIIPNATMVTIINPTKMMIINAITTTILRFGRGWRLRLQGRRTRRVS